MQVEELKESNSENDVMLKVQDVPVAKARRLHYKDIFRN